MIYETIYKKLYRLIPTLDSIEVGNAVTLKADAFMDLHVDVLHVGTYKDMACTRIALSHDYRHPSGDLIPDPDMEVAIYPKLCMAEALTYQDSFGYQEVYPDLHHVRPQLKKELNRFLSQWLSNLLQQGHQQVEMI